MLRLVVSLVIAFCAVPLLMAKTVITGTLLGADGKPMKKAHVHITESQNAQHPLSSVEVGRDGRYSITIEKKQPFFLVQYTGAFHQMHNVPLFAKADDKITVDVQLQANACEGPIESVQAIGDFNKFDFQSGIALQKQPNGTYAADITAVGDNLVYQLLVNDGHTLGVRSINGTMYDALEYDGGGDYRSVVKAAHGVVRLVFDPKEFPQTAGKATVAFGKDSKPYQAFSQLAEEAMARMNSIQMMSMMAQSPEEGEALGEKVKAMLQEMEQQVASESDAQQRQYRLLFYLELLSLTQPAKDKEHPTLERVFSEIAPNSLLWSYKPYLLSEALHLADQDKAQEYLKQVLETNHNDNVRRIMLDRMMYTAFYKGEKEEGMAYYNALLQEFPGSPEADNAKKQFSPDRAIQEGKTVPDFSFTALENEQVAYTRENMKGKYYLIDFWATWCGPCIGEMKNLHDAYEKFKGKNFTIISLSFDGAPDDVTKFRGKKWTMPWLHAFVKGNFKSDAAQAFEVAGIPKPILVGSDGTILASGTALRGDKLEETLAKYLVEAR